ncbi:MAG: hypothetical protein H6673_01480 [Anaerolineales bacterium]|nr:hypothetical protein [Anaerolineales bacterium]
MQPLKRSSHSESLGSSLFIAAIWLGISCFIFAMFVLTDGPIFGIFCTFAFVLIGLVLGLQAVRLMIANTKFAQPEININKTEIRVGDTFKLTYSQLMKKDMEIKSCTLDLVFRESATYRRGTDTVTVTHDHMIESMSLPIMSFQAGQVFQHEQTYTIPITAMHSFAANRNKLTWFFRIKIDTEGWADFERSYDLVVLPTV